MPNSVLASYSFLPWVRQGFGNEIIEADSLGNTLPADAVLERPEIQITAKVKASKEGSEQIKSILKTAKVQGPGDVLGVNHEAIIRTNPKRGVTNFETNNLCYVEFYEEDLPWRFTPARPVGNKLRPWLALVVLKENEFEKSTGGTPTPYITIAQEALDVVFCNEKDTYALAHVHVLEDLGDNTANPAPQLAKKLAQNQDLALSRILCPRKLEFTTPDPSLKYDPNVYHAFLIPAFETGRLAGLQLPIADIPAQQSSWSKSGISSGKNPTRYPYYYTWSFSVDKGGDFESLAELLEARELPNTVGKREMSMSSIGYGIETTQAADVIAFVEGAMKHPQYETAPWPMSDQDLRQQLLKVLNISADLQSTTPSSNTNIFYSPALENDPIIAPPIYGQWHKGVTRLRNNSSDWLHSLNLHPSHRAAAGLGVQVVQKHQETFMELAWEQIGAINEANQKKRESELMKRTSQVIANTKLFPQNELDLIIATGKTFDVLKTSQSSETLRRMLNKSVVPTALRSGTFAKIANNFTPTALMTSDGSDGATAILNKKLFTRLNQTVTNAAGGRGNSRISAALPRIEPQMALTSVQAYQAINEVVLNPPVSFMQSLADAIMKVNSSRFTTTQVLGKLNIDPNLSTKEKEAIKTRASDILNAVTSRRSNTADAAIELKISEKVFKDRISPNFNEGIYGSNKKVKFIKAGTIKEVILFDQQLIVENRANYLNEFTSKFMDLSSGIMRPKVYMKPVKNLLNANFYTSIKKELDPSKNFTRNLASLIHSAQTLTNRPLMAYPRFPFPVYNYLKEISADYIIPNISEIAPNTITLMEPNNQFIESFMMGMNHEFSRELLWREFPTDRRGSYFRHFWEYDNDPNATIELGDDYNVYINKLLSNQDQSADIKEIHKWNNSLGKNNHKKGPGLVLLIKGDLLRKYPNTLVYAQKAEFQANKNKQRELGDYNKSNVLWPIISGSLEPDVYFFGFHLTTDQANGNRVNDPGYFFVMRERPGQVSFGLDDLEGALNKTPENWDNVTWEHITGNASTQPSQLAITDVSIKLSHSGTGPRTAKWGGSSSDMAYILYQSPILFARHASTMLNS